MDFLPDKKQHCTFYTNAAAAIAHLAQPYPLYTAYTGCSIGGSFSILWGTFTWRPTKQTRVCSFDELKQEKKSEEASEEPSSGLYALLRAFTEFHMLRDGLPIVRERNTFVYNEPEKVTAFLG